MNKKNLLLLVIAIVIVLGFVYIKSQQNSSNKKIIKIGLEKLMTHKMVDDCVDGMIKGLADSGYVDGKNITIDLQNGQGDLNIQKAIAEKFAKSDYDLFLVPGTQPAQLLTKLIKDRPIVFGVTDPVGAGLVESKAMPKGNATGVTDKGDFKAQFQTLLKVAPNVKTVGTLENLSEANSVASMKELKEVTKELGLELIVVPIGNTNDIASAARSIVNKVDAFYTMPDNTMIAGEAAVIKVALENKKPFFTYEQSGVKNGGLLSVGGNYYKMGYKAGKMAARIIEGANPATTPVEDLGPEDVDLYLNQKTADKLGIKFSEEILKQATEVYR